MGYARRDGAPRVNQPKNRPPRVDWMSGGGYLRLGRPSGGDIIMFDVNEEARRFIAGREGLLKFVKDRRVAATPALPSQHLSDSQGREGDSERDDDQCGEEADAKPSAAHTLFIG